MENSQSKSKSLFENDPDFLTNKNNGVGTRELFFKFMVSVLFLVALGAGGIYVSKRFLPKITSLSGKEIRIAETVHLGPRKAVHLLEIGERRFLIGSTNENITRLADLTSTLTELSVREIDNN
ncbi:MAG: FliO/MopB family protein [Planctomycetes bacterium]|nr:FliO/MopB family protein [Planctomycetota bacterium]